MNKISIQYYKSPVGEILLGSYNGKLCLADWRYRKMRSRIDSRIQKALNAQYVEESSNKLLESLKPILEVRKKHLTLLFLCLEQSFKSLFDMDSSPYLMAQPLLI